MRRARSRVRARRVAAGISPCRARAARACRSRRSAPTSRSRTDRAARADGRTARPRGFSVVAGSAVRLLRHLCDFGPNPAGVGSRQFKGPQQDHVGRGKRHAQSRGLIGFILAAALFAAGGAQAPTIIRAGRSASSSASPQAAATTCSRASSCRNSGADRPHRDRGKQGRRGRTHRGRVRVQAAGRRLHRARRRDRADVDCRRHLPNLPITRPRASCRST